ncbi:MAG: hypothetical protein AAB910_02740 [Patescibacteria group bacterium]
MKLDYSQRKSLSAYCGNLSIAWLAAGVIGPIVTGRDLKGAGSITLLSILASAIFLLFMLFLVKERRRKV